MAQAEMAGLRILEWRLNVVREWADIATFGQPHDKILVEEYGNARFKMLWTEHAQGWLPRLLDGGSIRDLGPSAYCEACHTAWLPGTLICPNCGYDTRYEPLALEYEHQGIITGYTATSKVAEMAIIEVEMRILGKIDPSMLARPEALLTGRPGAWLCRFCGFYVVGKTSNCPGCGGNRVPIKELSRMERICVYCGHRTYGGFACPHCNGRLARAPSVYH